MEEVGIRRKVDPRRISGTGQLPQGVLVDSGAGASIANGDDFPEYELEELAGSRRGQHFAGPGGERMIDRGQKHVQIIAQEGLRSKITFQDTKARIPYWPRVAPPKIAIY